MNLQQHLMLLFKRKYLSFNKEITKKKTELSVALVSHDFGVIAGMCDYVYIMYRGNVVEKGNVEEIFF